MALAAPPFITVAGATMLPLRNFADWVGAKVDVSNTTFTLSQQTTSVELLANSHTMLVNGVEVRLHPPSLTKMGVLYAPLRPLAEAFGAKLKWDEKNHVVTLTHPTSGKVSLLAYPPIESPSLQRLFAAVRDGDSAKISTLLQAQPELLDMQDSAGRTALYVAIEGKLPAMVHLFLRKGADVDLGLTTKPLLRDPLSGGSSPLHAAVTNGDLAMVETLLEKKAPIRADYLGVTPLHLAATLGNMTMVQELIDHKANLDAKATLLPETLDPAIFACAAKPGYATPVMFAIQSGYDDIAAFLTEKGATSLDLALAKSLVDAAQRAKERATIAQDAQTECFHHLHTLYTNFTKCMQDNANTVPLAKDFWEQFQKYADTTALICPATPDEPIGYGFNAMLCGQMIDMIKDPDKVILFADCTNANHFLWDEDAIDRNRHGGGCLALFCDGHTAYLSADSELRLR